MLADVHTEHMQTDTALDEYMQVYKQMIGHSQP